MNRSFGSAKHKELDSQLPNGSLLSSNSGFYNSAKFSNVLHHGGCVYTYMNYLLILNRLRSFYYQNQTLYCVFNFIYIEPWFVCCQHVQQTKVSCWSRNFTRKETFLKNYVQHPILSCIGFFKKEKKNQLSVRSSFKGARSMSRLIHTDTRRVAGGRSFEPCGLRAHLSQARLLWHSTNPSLLQV